MYHGRITFLLLLIYKIIFEYQVKIKFYTERTEFGKKFCFHFLKAKKYIMPLAVLVFQLTRD